MATSWRDLSPRTRGLLLGAGTVDGLLRVAALVDLARRPREQVNGSKLLWGAGLAVVNSAGVLPVVYFLKGRRPAA